MLCRVFLGKYSYCSSSKIIALVISSFTKEVTHSVNGTFTAFHVFLLAGRDGEGYTQHTHGTRFSQQLSGPRFFGTHKRCVWSCVNVSSIRAFKWTEIESYDFLSRDQKRGGKSLGGLKHYRDVPITGVVPIT